MVPCEGELYYRGINIRCKGFTSSNIFGFEEVCYLLLFVVPNKKEYEFLQSAFKLSKIAKWLCAILLCMHQARML